MNKSGIYGVKCLVNNKIYVGSAVDLSSRLRTHKSRLNLNKHPNQHLQSACNKYGLVNFIFIILENCDKDKLLEREQFWIDWCESYKKEKGYNKRKTPNSNLGLKLNSNQSKEDRARVSLQHKNKIVSFDTKLKSSLSHQKLDKWPHGSKCKCRECKNLRNTLRLHWKYNKSQDLNL